MWRAVKTSLILLLVSGLLLASCNKPKSTDAPVTEDGDPILADVSDGKFQITKAYFEAAFIRVPTENRYRYTSLEGRREFLEKLTYEVVFYLEGMRRNLFRKKDFQRTLRAANYAAVNEMAKEELRTQVSFTDEQVRAEYDSFVTRKDEFPFDKMKERLRARLEARALEEAYLAKKLQLVEDWELTINYELLTRLNPFKNKDLSKMPKLTETVAVGKDYEFTVATLLMRLEEIPPERRKAFLENVDTKDLLEKLIGDDVVHNWARLKGLNMTTDFELRKKVAEVGSLSRVTRAEIVGEDVAASERDAQRYYREHRDEIFAGIEPPPFEAVRDLAIAHANEAIRFEAMRSLAKSLMAHRYPTVYFEPNIQQLVR